MRQRLGIAAALLRRPRLLILDEPATGLDPAGMRDMRELIRRLADEGITVLLSSHQLPEVQELCDRVAIVDRGRVVYEGALADLRRQGGAGYRLRTTDDARALELARAQPGIEHVDQRRARPRFQAHERDVGAAVAGAGAGRNRHPRAHAGAGHARGPVLPADRGQRRADRRDNGRARRDRMSTQARQRHEDASPEPDAATARSERGNEQRTAAPHRSRTTRARGARPR